MTALKKYPLLKFIIFTVIVNILCWGSFTLYDWAVDECNIVDGRKYNVADSVIIWAILILSGVLPVAVYFRLEKSFDSHKRNSILNSVCQIIIWIAVSLAFIIPICNAVDYNRWIVYQNKHSDFIDLNGLEYFIFPLFYAGAFIVLMPLVKLVRLIVRKVRNKT